MSTKRYGKVAVLMGGPSAEREVSFKSGAAVLDALKSRGVDAHGIDPEADVITRLQREQFERAFIVLHGRWGEDGVIQGALETIDMPYTGSGVLGSALGMDKLRCKYLWSGAGIPVPEYVVLERGMDLDRVAAQLGLPLFVKPVREGSSLGVTKVKRADELAPAFEAASQYDDFVIAERAIVGPEITCAILTGQALPLIRIEPVTEFYDYEAKYLRDDTRYHCPSGLPAATERHIQDIARRAFALVGCEGWGRVDFMVDADGRPYVLEINTVPGMTDHSLVPKAARQGGIEFDELVLRILATSERRR
jgi:D-alanine-D-alanine ligase